ncbi:CvpA family protein [Buchnera aphidicola]|uniref:Colicin V production protein n=1 Tax=Buchnera aphidicola subsp. Melaphis rhois TaxID=118103 RepID=A0A4D6YFR3_BUCMH|nr:colicin V production protein [Buchnera aphidicola (Melaphis rhois)]
MNRIDYISIVIIIISTTISFFRGFFQEIISVLMWGIGIYIFSKYYYWFSFLSIYINNKIIRYMIHFVTFFMFFLIIREILNYLIIAFINQFHLFVFNQILGICFGIIRGVLIICTILFFLEFSTNFVHSKNFKNSLLIPYYNYFIKILLKHVIKNVFIK